MEVEVELFGILIKDDPHKNKGKFRLKLDKDATVDQLVKRIPLPSGVRFMVLINGQRAETSSSLKDGDEVFIFSPVEGG